MNQSLPIDKTALEDFCLRHHIRKLSLFGSYLKKTAGPGSDVDFLVEFESDPIPGLMKISAMELELSKIMGERVDLRTAGDLSRYFRDEVIRTAEVQYAR